MHQYWKHVSFFAAAPTTIWRNFLSLIACNARWQQADDEKLLLRDSAQLLQLP
jgi:hypothetical protein